MLYTASDAKSANPSGWRTYQRINERLNGWSVLLGSSTKAEEEYNRTKILAETGMVRIATREERADSLSSALSEIQKIDNVDDRHAAFIATKNKHMQVLYVVKTWW
jgi:hypothetical protein